MPISFKASKEQRAIIDEARTTQVSIQAVENITIAGMHSALRIKQLQQQLELIAPASSEVLSLIAAAGCMDLVQVVQRFGQDVA